MQTQVSPENSYRSYCRHRYHTLTERYSRQQARLIGLLPLLIHTNKSLMPGLISRHTPQGIARYTPTDTQIAKARVFNKQFSYDPENLPEQASVESLFIQECIFSGEIILWVIHADHLDAHEIDLLEAKVEQIARWLNRSGIRMTPIVCTAGSISYSYYNNKRYTYHIDKCFFLDRFYAESLLIAGKPPAWWLYRENGTRSDSDVIYCGDLQPPRPNDYLSAAIWYLYNVFHQPDVSWFNLATMEQFISLEMHPFYSPGLRRMVHEHGDQQEHNIHRDYYSYLKDIIDLKHNDSIDHIINCNAYSLHNRYRDKHQHETLFDYMSGKGPRSISFRAYHDGMKYLLADCERLFNRIKDAVNLDMSCSSECLREINAIIDNLLSRLVNIEQKIAVINVTGLFTLEKACFNYTERNGKPEWALLADINDPDSVIYSSNNLIFLATWACTNRLLDQATQVSVRCPDFSLQQTDALNIIKTLLAGINFDGLVANIDSYTGQPRPVRSMLFIGHCSPSYQRQTIDHVIMYNTGEIFVHTYRGLQMFYNWLSEQGDHAIDVRQYGTWANEFRTLNGRILPGKQNITA